jgi:hypothetical protein
VSTCLGAWWACCGALTGAGNIWYDIFRNQDSGKLCRLCGGDGNMMTPRLSGMRGLRLAEAVGLPVHLDHKL